MSAAVVPVLICRVNEYMTSPSDDLLAVEEPLEIRLGRRSLSVTMRTPGSDFELAAGFLFSEGMIRDIAEVRCCGAESDIIHRGGSQVEVDPFR